MDRRAHRSCRLRIRPASGARSRAEDRRGPFALRPGRPDPCRRLRAERGDLPLDGLRAAVEQAARRLGTHQTVTELLAAPPEADLQLAVGRAHGVEAVAADVAERSLESL